MRFDFPLLLLAVIAVVCCAIIITPASASSFVRHRHHHHSSSSSQRFSNNNKQHSKTGFGQEYLCPARPPIPTTAADLQAANLTIPPALIARVEALLQTSLSPCAPVPPTSGHSTATGVIAALVFGDSVHYFTLGCSDKTTGAPVNQSTLFMMCSVSKTFVSQGLLQAVFKDGKIRSLDDSMSNTANLDFVVRGPRGEIDPTQQPTWRQLNSQLSGIRREVPCNTSNNCNVTLDTVLQRLNETRLILPANFRPAYSNLGFSLAGQVLAQKIYGKNTYNDYLQDVLLKPRNMSGGDTGCDLNAPGVAQRLATGYDGSGSATPLMELGFGHPDGGVYTNVVAAGKWVKNWLKGAASDAAVRESMLPRFVNPDYQSGFGSPWELYRTTSPNASGYFLTTKSGDGPGWAAQLVLMPELNAGIFAMWNGVGLPWDWAVNFGNIAVPPLQREVLNTFYTKIAPPTPSDVSSQLKGTSWSAGPSVPLSFSLVAAPTTTQSTGAPFASQPNTLLMITPGFGNYILVPVPNDDSNSNSNNDVTFRIEVYPDSNMLPCLLEEFVAIQGEYLVFHRSSSSSGGGLIRSATMPGLFYDSVFTATKS